MIFVQTQYLDSVLQTLYVNGEASDILIDKMVVCNVDVAGHAFYVYIVPSGAAPGIGNRLLQATVSVGASNVCDEIVGFHLTPGDSIAAYADAVSAMTIRVTGRVV